MIIKYTIPKTNAGSAAGPEFLVWSYFRRTGRFLGDSHGKFVSAGWQSQKREPPRRAVLPWWTAWTHRGVRRGKTPLCPARLLPELRSLMSSQWLQCVLPHSWVICAHKPEIKKHCLTRASLPKVFVATEGPFFLFLFLEGKKCHQGFPGTRHGSVPPHHYANLGLRAILINGMLCTCK